MKTLLKILALASVGVIIGCNSADRNNVATVNADPYANNSNSDLMLVNETPFDESDPLVKDNFDLQRAGEFLRKSRDPGAFEAYLNERDGVNNLDLNGDGFVDYISVEEFDDRADGQRGLSLFARYGPDLIQNIASIFFYRDEPRYPGARVLLRGDDVLYGDNYYYETNWLDTSLGIANLLFGNHDRYVSPYYYDRYPPNYVVYDVVETPIYRSRIDRLYPDPVFVYSASAPQFYERITIDSPMDGRYFPQIYARPMKPTRAQIDFRRNNPGKPLHARKNRLDDGPGKSENAPGQRGVPPGHAKDIVDGPASDKGRGNPGGPPKADKPGRADDRGKPDNPGKGGPPDKGKGGQGQGKGKGKGKP